MGNQSDAHPLNLAVWARSPVAPGDDPSMSELSEVIIWLSARGQAIAERREVMA